MTDDHGLTTPDFDKLSARFAKVRKGLGHRWITGALGCIMVVVVLCSCTGSSSDSEQDIEHLKELGWSELLSGSGVEELGVSKYSREVGVIELLERYLINVPPTAEFISTFEIIKSRTVTLQFNSEAATENEMQRSFEAEVLSLALSAVGSLTQTTTPQQIHDAFFEVFEECGRNSRWPDIELFELSNGRGFDLVPEIVEASYEISPYEYQLLKHECARHAATYPNLDKSTRDELLAPQREHYATIIVDGILDNSRMIVPNRYREEWNELVASGW